MRAQAEGTNSNWKTVQFCRQAYLAQLVPRRAPRLVGFKPGDAADISISHYERNPLPFMGKQRNGICCTISTAESRVDHARKALKMRFPLSQENPMPRELSAALDFVRTSAEEDILTYWKHQVDAQSQLAENPKR